MHQDSGCIHNELFTLSPGSELPSVYTKQLELTLNCDCVDTTVRLNS